MTLAFARLIVRLGYEYGSRSELQASVGKLRLVRMEEDG